MENVHNTIEIEEPARGDRRITVHVEQPRPKQWELLALVPIVAGLHWLLGASGFWWWAWALVPGAFLLSSGVALLFMPGDPRVTGYMAAAGVIGAVFCLPAWIVADAGTAFFALLGSVASFLVAGRVALTREPLYVGATPPEFSTRMDVKAAFDEALLGYFVGSAQLPSGEDAAAMCEEALRFEAIVKARGWDKDPAGLHPAPPAPDRAYIGKSRILGRDYEVLSFDSGFTPDEALPGAATWKSYAANSRCHVRILRHAGGPRPWLLCVHGYRMGVPLLDFSLFSPTWLHDHLGYNIIQPVLPLHGPRSIGLRTGDFYLDGDMMDLVFAQSQALWDLRRTLAWLRQNEERPQVGVFGFSLGGYNSALLVNHDRDLEFVVAAIPVVDYARALWRFMPAAHNQYFVSRGLDEQRYRTILRPVSPLAGLPRIERDRLFILGATGDRIVQPYHPLQLSAHWGVPVNWYQGSHLSVRQEPQTREVLKQALARAGWR